MPPLMDVSRRSRASAGDAAARWVFHYPDISPASPCPAGGPACQRSTPDVVSTQQSARRPVLIVLITLKTFCSVKHTSPPDARGRGALHTSAFQTLPSAVGATGKKRCFVFRFQKQHFVSLTRLCWVFLISFLFLNSGEVTPPLTLPAPAADPVITNGF